MYAVTSSRNFIYEILSPKSEKYSTTARCSIVYAVGKKCIQSFIRKTKVGAKVILGEVIANYPLQWNETVAEVRREVARMTPAEKWELVEQSFGMWKDYPADWLELLRNGSLKTKYDMKSTLSDYVLRR